jgi:hypothetical protein
MIAASRGKHMIGRVGVWTALAIVGIAAAAMIDAFVFPSPPSTRRQSNNTPIDKAVSLASALYAGSPFPEKVVVVEGGRSTTLPMTGSYVRSRKIVVTIDFYEIASYVADRPSGSTDEMLESIWSDDGKKVYLLRFLFSVPGWQLRQAIHDEIARSFKDVSVDDHKEELDRMRTAFGTGAAAGDVFYLVRLPGNRIYLGVRNEKDLSLVTTSPPLARAIWRMWAGPTAEPGRAGLVKLLETPAASGS